MSPTIETLHLFEKLIAQRIPGFKVAFKDEDRTQKLLGKLLSPINPDYMTRYATTLYPTVWFPSRQHYEENIWKSLLILAHEYVHLYDARTNRVTFSLKYLLPQVLLWPIALFILGISLWYTYTTSWWGLLGLLWVLPCALIHTSPWRTQLELRGYGMQVAFQAWGKKPLEKLIPWLNEEFTGPSYLWMCDDEEFLLLNITDLYNRASQGESLGEPYDDFYRFCREQSLL